MGVTDGQVRVWLVVYRFLNSGVDSLSPQLKLGSCGFSAGPGSAGTCWYLLVLGLLEPAGPAFGSWFRL